MTSEISKTLRAYQRALDESRGRYESLYTARGQNAPDFYQRYAYRLVRYYARRLRLAAGCIGRFSASLERIRSTLWPLMEAVAKTCSATSSCLGLCLRSEGATRGE